MKNSVSLAGLTGLFLAIAAPLQASIVVTVPSIPPTVSNEFFAPPIELDFDGGGTVDFVIPGNSTQINVQPEGFNRVISVFDIGSYFAEDLTEGSFIGAIPEAPMEWTRGAIMSGCWTVGCGGNFLGGIEFLGVEFDINGRTHYGWAEIESQEFVQFVRVHRWAYETDPGVGIRAGQIPEPSAVILLLVGTALFLSRRRGVIGT